VKRKHPKYTVWVDNRTNCFEVVRWDQPDIAVVVQTNILTREKAEAACRIWQQRETERQAQSSPHGASR
jgi:hypothetical protein